MAYQSRIDTFSLGPLASVQRQMRVFRTEGCIGASLCALAAAVLASAPAPASAAEPRSVTEPRIMNEGGEVTQVISSFDDGDPFDLNISLGFDYASKSARILRESSINSPGLASGGYTSKLMNVATYSETQSRLVPRLDIGVWRDVAVYVRMPIVLSNTRELGDLDGSSGKLPVVAGGILGETLFGVPFKAPARSGIEYIATGLEFDLLTQARDRSKPTWKFGIEGRFPVGTPMHACNTTPKAGQVQCADPSDVNRNGKSDNSYEGSSVAERSPGISRGTIGLEGHTLISKRWKYVEPYGGFGALFEFQQASSDYGMTDLQGSLVNHPPFVGSIMLGLMVIPWENREKFGRLTFDLRFTGQYHSEGRDYSELFDALGSSDAASLRNPQYAKFTRNPGYDACKNTTSLGSCPQSVADQSSQKTYFTGLTDVAPYGSYRGAASVTWQASEYVKFSFGMGLRHDQSHGITGDQPCNPDFRGNADESGVCHAEAGANSYNITGIPNPNYRPSINSVGRRFFVDQSNTFDVFASGVVMF